MSEQEVQAYLDQHKIQTTVEDAINACVKANAADPCLFMSQHLASKAGPETITAVKARQIFDSRGNPTVEVDVITTKGKYTAMVPSGASTGIYEGALGQHHATFRLHSPTAAAFPTPSRVASPPGQHLSRHPCLVLSRAAARSGAPTGATPVPPWLRQSPFPHSQALPLRVSRAAPGTVTVHEACVHAVCRSPGDARRRQGELHGQGCAAANLPAPSVWCSLSRRAAHTLLLPPAGVMKAVANVNTIIGPALVGMSPAEQVLIDDKMVQELDGSKNEWGWSKSKLGANAILGVSMAVCKAGAAAKGMPLYKHIAELAGNPTDKMYMPVPAFNIINGGSHAGNKLAMQEFMILPIGASTFTEVRPRRNSAAAAAAATAAAAPPPAVPPDAAHRAARLA